MICSCGAFLYCQHEKDGKCIYLEDDEEEGDDVEKMQREESLYIDRQNAKEINK